MPGCGVREVKKAGSGRRVQRLKFLPDGSWKKWLDNELWNGASV